MGNQKKRKIQRMIAIQLVFIPAAFLVLNIFVGVVSSIKYDRQYQSYWSLAEKSSTIEKKTKYMDKYVESLEMANLEGGYNSVFAQTPDNSFDFNMEALKSLQQRLHEIQHMDVASFEYQTAIQQITQQEQGEADQMNNVFKGVWYKSHYPLLWSWVCIVQVLLLIIALVSGIIWWVNVNESFY